MRSRAKITVALLGALLGVLLPAATAGAALIPAPAWQIRAVSYPTNFVAGSIGDSEGGGHGPGYLLVAKNIGGAPSSGKFTITATLPTGLAPSFKAKPTGDYGPEGQHLELSCTASAHLVSCSGTGAVLYPGQEAIVDVPLEVSTKASGLLSAKAAIEGGGAAAVSSTFDTLVSSSPATFGFLETVTGAYGSANNADGSTATQAGSHPYQLGVGMGFKMAEAPGINRVPGGGIRTIEADLPRGMVANPEATPKCTEPQLESNSCPGETQIGTVTLTVSLNAGRPGPPIIPLYNMVPPPGTASSFGMEVLEGLYVHLLGRVRSNGEYRLGADVNSIPAKVGLTGAETTLWGLPSDESHDRVRGLCIGKIAACPTTRTDTALVTLPSHCTANPLQTALRIDNWVGEGAATSYPSTDPAGNPVGVNGCNQLDFSPTITVQPTTNLADSPTGLDVDLHIPQNPSFDGLAEANLKDTTVTLPAGVALNPSAAAGLGSCSEAQIGLGTTIPASCPEASKVGTVEVSTPLLDHPLPGSVYLATPHANPFNSLLALYIAVEDGPNATGVTIKLPGKVSADPQSGQLSASFGENPELPFEDFRLHFFGGPRAATTSPLACGEYQTVSTLTPWTTPEGADVTLKSPFSTTIAADGGACPNSEASAPKTLSFTAGTQAPQAGAYSPFSLKLTRPDGSQRITAIDATLPKGLTGKLAGVPYCSEAQLAVAKAREAPDLGALEQQSPSCPLASEVGTATVGAGSGITPFYVTGRAYLAGPYKGAPLSLAIITPAVAGPFDLGTVVVRSALYVDPETAQIHAVSDPLPTIREGIPLDVRSVLVQLTRPQFSLNPTSCDPMAITGAATTAAGQSAPLSSPFQVGGCSALPFKPSLRIRLKGPTNRSGHPALIATATAKPGEANIGAVSVTLPHSEFLDQGHIKTICTRVQFAAGKVPGEECPVGSIYGKATATTPLLDGALSGPVFLRSSSHALPDLVVALHGQVDVVVAGRVDSVHGGLRNSFEAVPDAPITKFTLEMQGGKKGLIVNSRNICNSVQRASVSMEAQSGKTNDFRPLIKNGCQKKAREHRRRHR